MLESAVILSALGIVSALAGALIWLLKKLFTQNEVILAKVSNSIDKLSDTLDQSNEGRTEFRHHVVTTLGTIKENVLLLVENKS